MTTQRTTRTEAARQARLAEALRIAQERFDALQANALPVTEIHYTTNPGPDFSALVTSKILWTSWVT